MPRLSAVGISGLQQQNQAPKAMAALAGKSIKQFTLECLFPPRGAEIRQRK